MHDKVIVICLANVFFPTSEFLHGNYKAISIFFFFFFFNKKGRSKYEPPKIQIPAGEHWRMQLSIHSALLVKFQLILML